MNGPDLASYIRDVPDFPKPGVLFKDITTLLKDPTAFREAVDRLAAPFESIAVDVVVGMESRGFIFAAPLAYKLDAGFVPVRKTGRLPAEAVRVSYDLEYGHNTLELHRDAIQLGQRVLIVDDLLATGGTVLATIDLVEQLGGKVVGLAFLIELRYLNGRRNLVDPPPIVSLIEYGE
ncbi:MAG: adenine phosphoribosyltransferase [Chloroflexota bacterium]